MDLMIVESPTKTKTIEPLLNSGDRVVASYGHIRDLPRKEMGMDLETFDLQYEFIPGSVFKGRKMKGAKERIAEIRKLVAKADMVYLATDPDREGEAIAWHLKEALGLRPGKYLRVTFHSLDKPTVQKGLANARDIDYHLVYAQEARRALDRMVGYTVSPMMTRTINKGRSREDFKPVSAGRVQSPALKYVVDRERKIRNFKSVNHFGAQLSFDSQSWTADWQTKPYLKEGEEYILDRSLAESAAGVKTLTVRESRSVTKEEKPPAPFTTSTLLQAASVSLRFGSEITSKVAQKLFENGHITYHRTDSTNLADETIKELRAYAEEKGLPLPDKPRRFSSKGGAQEAHEAIRPKHFEIENIDGSHEEKALYRLIWERAVACQLSVAKYKVNQLVLEGKNDGKSFEFKASGRKLIDPGWRTITKKAADHDEHVSGKDKGSDAESGTVPKLDKGLTVDAETGKVQEKETKPPQRYTEAGLIKVLEKGGVGRPSTYSATMKNIRARGYVVEKKRYLHPTQLGERLIDELVKNGFSFVNPIFTKKMEEELDEVAAGRSSYYDVVKTHFHQLDGEMGDLGGMRAALDRLKPTPPPVDENGDHYPCPDCGKPMFRRKRKDETFFWGCSAWKNSGCKGVMDDEDGKPVPKKGPEIPKDSEGNPFPCPDCGEPLLKRKRKDGGHFWSCSTWRKTGCQGSMDDKDGKPVPKKGLEIPTDENGKPFPCPECGKPLLRRKRKDGGHFWSCSSWRKTGCQGSMNDKDGKPVENKDSDVPVDDHGNPYPCPMCGAPLRLIKTPKNTFWGCTAFRKTGCKGSADDKDGVPAVRGEGSDNDSKGWSIAQGE